MEKMFYGVSRVKSEDMDVFLNVLKITDDVDCLSCETLADSFGIFFIGEHKKFQEEKKKILMRFLLSIMIHQVEVDTIDGYQLYDVDEDGGVCLCK
mgnify:FL=1